MQRNNLDAISKALGRKTSGKGMSLGVSLEIAERLWTSVSNWIDAGNLDFENRSFNLRDSIACGVYENGRLVKLFTFTQKGTNKIYHYHGMELRADGLRLVRNTFFNRPYTAPGINIVFRCPLNYGFFLEHGLGPLSLADGGDSSKKAYHWWSDGLVPFINSEFNKLKYEYS